MNKLILVAVVSLFLITGNYASTFTFVRTSPDIVYYSPDSISLYSYATVNNTTSSNISIIIDLTIISMPSGWDTLTGFCTWVNCYPTGYFHVVESCPPGEHNFDVYVDNPNHVKAYGTVKVQMKYQTDSISQTFGFSTWPVGIKQISSSVTDFRLNQNYPNPFNPSTKIGFTIPKNENVDLRVYDILGREVAVIVSGFVNAGEYEVEFDAKNLASGMYYYRLKTPENVAVRKMTLVK